MEGRGAASDSDAQEPLYSLRGKERKFMGMGAASLVG
jgi:hypothetical protein